MSIIATLTFESPIEMIEKELFGRKSVKDNNKNNTELYVPKSDKEERL